MDFCFDWQKITGFVKACPSFSMNLLLFGSLLVFVLYSQLNLFPALIYISSLCLPHSQSPWFQYCGLISDRQLHHLHLNNIIPAHQYCPLGVHSVFLSV